MLQYLLLPELLFLINLSILATFHSVMMTSVETISKPRIYTPYKVGVLIK